MMQTNCTRHYPRGFRLLNFQNTNNSINSVQCDLKQNYLLLELHLYRDLLVLFQSVYYTKQLVICKITEIYYCSCNWLFRLWCCNFSGVVLCISKTFVRPCSTYWVKVTFKSNKSLFLKLLSMWFSIHTRFPLKILISLIFQSAFLYYTGCRKMNLFQVGGLVGKNLRNLEKIK
jgi:hypothetical protein